MIEFISGIELLGASSLWVLAALPLLVLAYLKRKQTRKRMVSSLLLLKRLSNRRSLQSRFKPPLRFFLELLLLLALAVSSSLPVLKNGAGSEVFVVDTSLSMQAKDPAHGLSRLDEAKRKIREIVELRPFATRFSLYRTSPRLRLIGEKGVSAAVVLDKLNELEPLGDSDALGTALSELAESEGFSRYYVLSDQDAELEEVSPESSGQSKEHEAIVEYHRLGQEAENFYISYFQLEPAGLGETALRAVANLGFSGARSRSLDVLLFAIKGDGSSQLIQSLRNLEIQPDRASRVEFSISEHADVFKLELHAQGNEAALGNALLEDDFAWAAPASSAGFRVLLVKPDAGGGALGLERIPTIKVDVIDSSTYEGLSQDSLSPYHLIIFHRTAPATVVRSSMLFILPPDKNVLFPIAATVTSPRISSWAGAHPLTTYLKVPELKLGETLIFQVPLWAKSIINVEQGSVLAAGESRGFRFAASGFELLPFEGARTPGSSILLLNLFSWLSSNSQSSFTPSTGGHYRLDGPGSYLIRTPQRATESFDLLSSEVKHYELLSAGPYFLAKTLSVNGQVEKTRSVLCVNSIFPEESTTFVRTKTALPQKIVSLTMDLDSSSQVLWPYLLSGALALLLLEFLLRLRKKGGGAE